MGLLLRMAVLRSATIDKLPESRYKAVIVTAEAEEENTVKSELWAVPGIIGIPTDDTMGIRAPIGGGSAEIIIATKNKLEPPSDLQKGETIVFSTDAQGSEIKAKSVHRANGDLELNDSIIMKSNGDIELNGDDKTFVTWSELNTALTTLASTLTAHVHPSNGAPSPGLVGLSIDISSAETTTIKTGG